MLNYMTHNLLIAFITLQIVDICTTYYIIRKGIGIEANPIMAFLINNIGTLLGLVIPKTVMITLVYLFIPQVQYDDWILGLLSILYIYVIVNNGKIINTSFNNNLK